MTDTGIVKIKAFYSLILLLFLSIFVYSCSSSSSLDEKERKTLTKFFEELLLEHGGAYTLFGSKPATIEDLIFVMYEQNESKELVRTYKNEREKSRNFMKKRTS